MSNDSKTTQRNELVDEIAAHPIGKGFYATCIGAAEAREISEAILTAGYSKPTILGYVVVGRDGGFVTGRSYSTRTEAQAIADEWTVGAKTNQIDWEYRVAEIVEATK